ncbi:1-phosphofructokinase [Crenobacter sp. SG2303]|uniref:Phosphofructokinase n=1 Tax=Crenobacter oryzisoli TaxID=3056844 RepID=A0ABT7XIM3_9NEIS|nr:MULTISPECIES: 1-phosphofructokinase [unclassified Crenobacter]MDN0073634.1 1-phosphofructokinase [Crenobacter sp. SG2303]MDN0082961.1 1-phosphofructokinase [Crenobacter sp. SG2305]
MSGPVITVTLNPAIDQTVTLDGLYPGSVNLAKSVTSNAGGKGVNVASCLADWGTPVLATGLLGKSNSEPFETLFEAKGILDRFLRVPGSTRVNIKIADTCRNETTDINLPGLDVDEEDLDRLMERLGDLTELGRDVVLAGSLPAGLPADSHARVIARLNQFGARVLLDTSGAPLVAALAAPREALPACIKPNRHELEQWAGRPLPTLDDVVSAAFELQQRGIEKVAVSLGEDGALFVDGKSALLASLPVINAVSTVGAGDALVAGLISAWRSGADAEGIARRAVAFAAAKLGRIGPHLPDATEVINLGETVTIQKL